MTSAHGGGWSIRAERVFTPAGVLDDAWVEIDPRGRIARVARMAEAAPTGEVMDIRPLSLAAGLIDIHVHGAAGHDFMDAEDEGFDAICRWHAEGGTTSLLVTTCAAPLDELARVLDTVERWQSRANIGARVLGAHVEGPFFNMNMRGCHLPEFVIDPSASAVDRVLEQAGAVRHLTIAPELPGAIEAIERFSAAGTCVAVAHSDADEPVIERAIAAGLRHVTHLFNAMSYYHKRGPLRVSGVVECALVKDELTIELISDGLHVNSTRLKLALGCKGADRTSLVTDAMRGAGMPDGLYAFGPRTGKVARVSGRRAVMPEGTGFASSTVTMMDCVRGMMEGSGASLTDALRMASASPAHVLGLSDRKGSLAEGFDADLIAFDADLRVQLTVVQGEVVHRAEALLAPV